MIQILLSETREIPLGGGFKGIGTLGDPKNAPELFAKILSNIIGFMTVIAGLWFIFNVIIAGYQWLSAGADKQKVADARGKLTYSVLGLVVVVAAIFLVRLVANLLGIQDVLNPMRAIELLKP